MFGGSRLFKRVVRVPYGAQVTVVSRSGVTYRFNGKHYAMYRFAKEPRVIADTRHWTT